jgi:phage FluMu gp28-like protein
MDKTGGSAAGAAAAAPAISIFVPSKESPLSILLPYQVDWVRDESRFKIGVWSRQTGKSFGTACEAVRSALTQPRNDWTVLSAGERQVMEWMEKAKQWTEAFGSQIADYAEERARSQALVKSAQITFPNGSRILGIPANPATARGYSSNLILDEFAFHERPDEIWRAIYPTITNPLKGRKALRIVSTPNGRGNKFCALWEHEDKKIKWARHKVTIHDAIRMGLALDIEELKEGLDDAEGWAQEYECEFLDTSNVLLPYEMIALAESIEASEVWDRIFTTATQLYLGIDFGRTSDPTVCWILERLGDVLWTRGVIVIKATSTPDQMDILRPFMEAAGRICLDYTGPGIGFGDYAVKEFGEFSPKEHKFGKVECFTFTAGSKRELFPLLRRKFEAPCKLRIPVSVEIREDLHAMQQIVKNGEYNYWAPRGPDGHSDRCTALALSVRAAGEPGNGAITDASGIIIGGQRSGGGRVFTPRWLPRIMKEEA